MNMPARMPRTLSDSDKARLEKLAPLFDIQFKKIDGTSYSLKVDGGKEHTLSARFAHFRLLSELCSKTVGWIYFHKDETCDVSFLSETDERFKRLSSLYRKRKASGEAGLELDAA